MLWSRNVASRFRINVIEQISQKYCGICSQTIAKMDFDIISILYQERLSVGNANHFVFDYCVRVCINQSRDYRVFFASKPNRQMLIDAVRVSANVTRLILYKEMSNVSVLFWIL